MKLTRLFAIGTLFWLHVALVIYMNATYLGLYLSPRGITLTFAAASLLSLFFLMCTPILARYFGVRRSLFLILVGIGVLLAVLAYPHTHTEYVLTAFVLYFASTFVVTSLIDVLIERETPLIATGKIRGLYLTFMNSAILVGPTLASVLIFRHGIWMVYAAASAVVFIAACIVALMPRRPRVHHEIPSWREGLVRVLKTRHLRKIFLAEFGLQFFYGVMTMALVSFLLHTAHVSLGALGIILFCMLIPFLLFEYPLGVLCDRLHLEHRVLAAGFLIMSIGTTAMLVAPAGSVLLLAAALFVSRVGAASVEVGSESYFFRHLKGEVTGVVSLFRALVPLGFLAAAIVDFVFIRGAYTFIALAVCMVVCAWTTYQRI